VKLILKKIVHFCIVIVALIASGVLVLRSENTKDHAIIIDTRIDSIPSPRIIFTWQGDTNAVEYSVWRKSKTQNDWGTEYALLDSNATGFIDSNISVTIGYEYKFKRKTAPFDAFSYIYAGINLPDEDYRGMTLLLVDETVSSQLKDELDRYQLDLIGDGWQVIRRDVPRTEQYNGEAVQFIKKIILDEYKIYKDTIKSIILFGRIAVPYSGDICVDEHEPDHHGAWAADLYYGEIDGIWHDSLVNDKRAIRPENKNIPGDGKFDEGVIPSDVDIAVGRIDLFNLPAIKKTELEMLRNYLIKDHNFRNKIISVRPYALIDDKFYMYGNEAFASNAWMDFPALVHAQNIDSGDYRYGMENESYLWSYGCNSGSYNSVLIIAYTWDMDSIPYNSIFTILFGSYLGDFDSQDNIMRASLASSPSILTCCWSGRPFWHFHHMSLGETIGYSTLLSQNNQYLYESSCLYGNRLVHVALMGDPTLRLHTVSPPNNAQITYSNVAQNNNQVKILWSPSQDSIIGYNIYRSNALNGRFFKVNSIPVKDTNYVDTTAPSGTSVYMVRALKLEQSATGSYNNQSEGIFTSTNIPKFEFSMTALPTFNYYPNPSETGITISILQPKTENFNILIYDLSGNLVKELASGIQSPNIYQYQYIWNLTDTKGTRVSSGVYLLKYTTDEFVKTAKLMVY